MCDVNLFLSYQYPSFQCYKIWSGLYFYGCVKFTHRVAHRRTANRKNFWAKFKNPILQIKGPFLVMSDCQMSSSDKHILHIKKANDSSRTGGTNHVLLIQILLQYLGNIIAEQLRGSYGDDSVAQCRQVTTLHQCCAQRSLRINTKTFIVST